MKKIKLSILPLMIFTVSCNLNKPSFCFENDATKAYVAKNGDIIQTEYSQIKTYSDFKRTSTADDVIRMLDSNYQVIIFLYSTTCPICEGLLPTMAEFEIDSSIEVFYFNLRTNITELNRLINRYSNGNYSTVFSSLTTPSMFLLQSPMYAEKIDISSISSATDLENKISSLVNVTNLTNFYSYSGFVNRLEAEGLLYVLNTINSESNVFYANNIVQKAKISSFKTSIINWQKLNQVDQENFKNLFHISDDIEVVLTYDKHGSVLQKYSYITDTNNASSLASSYYSLLE